MILLDWCSRSELTFVTRAADDDDDEKRWRRFTRDWTTGTN